MDIKPIRTDADHEAALQEIEKLWGAEQGSAEGDRLDILVTLADAYEDQKWPLEDMDPVEAIEAAMVSQGHSRAELGKLIGQNRATEILRRQRSLTLPMIRRIAKEWHVPERLLVKEYALN